MQICKFNMNMQICKLNMNMQICKFNMNIQIYTFPSKSYLFVLEMSLSFVSTILSEQFRRFNY